MTTAEAAQIVDFYADTVAQLACALAVRFGGTPFDQMDLAATGARTKLQRENPEIAAKIDAALLIVGA